MTQDVFGRKGHFTTSPEISQVFGEVMYFTRLQTQAVSFIQVD